MPSSEGDEDLVSEPPRSVKAKKPFPLKIPEPLIMRFEAKLNKDQETKKKGNKGGR